MLALRSSLLVISLLLCGRSVSRGQTAFERAITYANQVAQLNDSYATRNIDFANGLQQMAELTKLYRVALKESAEIQAAGRQQEYLLAMESLMQAYRYEVFRQESRDRPGRLMEYRTQAENATKVVVAASQLSQIQTANNVTNTRIRDLMTELARLSEELHKTYLRQQETFAEYVALADVYGMRTELEIKAALRELADIPAENLGARYLKAVTQRRLGLFEEAEAGLVELIEMQTPHTPRFIAARAEVLSLLDEGKEAESLLNKLARIAGRTAYYHGYRGLVETNSKSWKEAVDAWNAGLKYSGDELALHRNLAIVLSIRAVGNQSDARKALEHAELASRLSQNKEWSIELARAMALAANDRQDEAEQAVELASELTSGECLMLCSEILESIRSGQAIEWDFINH